MGQIKSKKRVADHGEVFTAEREVKAMCDLVGNECLRIDSRFLEPACGDGNFLSEILSRKLEVVRERYRRSAYDWERNSLLALGSLYGVDILVDNCSICRERLYKQWEKAYKAVCKKECNEDTRQAAKFILARNIVCGNALSLCCVDENQNDTHVPIIFSEWTFPQNNAFIHRKDYIFSELLNRGEDKEVQESIFDSNQAKASDGEGVFIKGDVSHYRRLGDEANPRAEAILRGILMKQPTEKKQTFTYLHPLYEFFNNKTFEWDRLQRIKDCLDAGMLHTALELAVVIPDICGRIKCRNAGKWDNAEKGRYIEWFNKYVLEDTTPKDTNLDKSNGYFHTFTGEMCYQLRCCILHGDPSRSVEKLINNPESSWMEAGHTSATFSFQDSLSSGMKSYHDREVSIKESLPMLIMKIVECGNDCYAKEPNKDLFSDGYGIEHV